MFPLQDDYKMLVNQLIGSRNDPAVKQKLVENFNSLAEDVEYNASKTNRVKFKAKFESFLSKVRGVIHVK